MGDQGKVYPKRFQRLVESRKLRSLSFRKGVVPVLLLIARLVRRAGESKPLIRPPAEKAEDVHAKSLNRHHGGQHRNHRRYGPKRPAGHTVLTPSPALRLQKRRVFLVKARQGPFRVEAAGQRVHPLQLFQESIQGPAFQLFGVRRFKPVEKVVLQLADLLTVSIIVKHPDHLLSL